MGPLAKLFKAKILPADNITEASFETVRIDREGNVTGREKSQCRILRQHLSEEVYLDMAFIPAGSFLMGSPLPGTYKDEKPQHYVYINKFLMSVTGITQKQWKAVMENCIHAGVKAPIIRLTGFHGMMQ